MKEQLKWSTLVIIGRRIKTKPGRQVSGDERDGGGQRRNMNYEANGMACMTEREGEGEGGEL